MLKLRMTILTTFLAILVAPCAPMTATPSPIPTEDPTEVPATASVAVVKSIEILILESFPVQVNEVIRGDLPDAGCTMIASVNQVREGNTFKLTLVTTTDPLALCAQALTPFEQVVALDVRDLPAGQYTVSAGGVEETFELSVDNSLTQPTDTNVLPTDVEYVTAQQDVQIHSGPGTQYSVIGSIASGQAGKVTGVSADEAWWRVMCPDDTVGNCWVSADPSLTQPSQPPD